MNIEEIKYKNPETDLDMVTLYLQIQGILPELLQRRDLMKSLKVLHDEPEVWRIWWQLGEVRIMFHKIMPAMPDQAFFHPHPWPSKVRILKGHYINTIGIYNGPKKDVEKLLPEELDDFGKKLVPMEIQIGESSMYSMLDVRQFHKVVSGNPVYSLMIIGLPYFAGATKQFSRQPVVQNPPLTEEEQNEIIAVVKQHYNIS